MTLCGYFLGQIPWIGQNFELVVIGIVLVSVLPIAIGMFRHWRAGRNAAAQPALTGAGDASER